ncbi:MAG: hypothetical protein KDD38_07145, partial [Bdellovibrionales bacterium]|nr:hypothetical protein [Bdellovibrionales bacterium]
VGLYGVVLEAGILLSFTIFFGSFASPMMAVAFSIGLFLIGHWLDSLKYFAEKSDSVSFQYFAKVIQSVLPNLEKMNWRSLFVYSDAIPVKSVMMTSGYSVAWCVFLITVSAMIMRGRDLG